MHTATLYQPDKPAQNIKLLSLNISPTAMLEQASSLLGCIPTLVDVLATGSEYIAYSIFDYEGAVNLPAMQVLERLAGASFNPGKAEEHIMGPILIITFPPIYSLPANS